ncbi:MAG: DUF2804 domain-containing protein [Bermanella sp.]
MENLINHQGQVKFGLFENTPSTINHHDFDLRDHMDKPIKGLRKKMKFNQFQFIGLTGEDFILGVAIVNLKWVSNCFIYIYEPKTKNFKEYSWLKPLAMQTQSSNQPNNGDWSFKSGKNEIKIQSTPGARQLLLKIGDELNVDICIDEKTTKQQDNYQPLAVCCRAGYSGWVFTQKATALEFNGDIKWQNRHIDTNNLLASVDWSCGYMRRETFWNWASLSHKTENGTKVGLNLAVGVNETSHTENGLWINNELIKLDRAEFIFERANRLNTWQVKTSDGHINLTFEPEGERKEKINAGFIASNFTQLFGRFYGQVKDKDGNTIEIDGAMGFCEDHFAKW